MAKGYFQHARELSKKRDYRRKLLRNAINDAMKDGAAPHIVRSCVPGNIGSVPLTQIELQQLDALDAAIRLRVSFDVVPEPERALLQSRVADAFGRLL